MGPQCLEGIEHIYCVLVGSDVAVDVSCLVCMHIPVYGVRNDVHISGPSVSINTSITPKSQWEFYKLCYG